MEEKMSYNYYTNGSQEYQIFGLPPAIDQPQHSQSFDGSPTVGFLCLTLESYSDPHLG